jgi:ATP-binding protein involved in chromosome partitioning
MSYLEHAGERLYIFGKGGGARTAEIMKVPLLAEIPLDEATRQGGDVGKPISTASPASAQALIFERLARTVIERANQTKNRHRPTMTVSD